jgi:hypothetical protein
MIEGVPITKDVAGGDPLYDAFAPANWFDPRRKKFE